MRAELPTGTVTFVFTDVECSTSLLNELGTERYADALADHRAVIRQVCADNGGVEVDTQGDAFFIAFPTAPGAVAAASALTDRLGTSGPVRVRVGVHTGTPFIGEEGYIGHDVHRAARIAAAGHGGQVLVSATTAALVEAELTDLGEHRFKDLGAPERVFQLGDVEFPSLNSLYKTNLPVPATPFLGRERELRDVVELMTRDDTRLVTLTGPGGSGKTRLMLQAAAEASDGFPDGVYWVPLAPLRDESAVPAAFAQALNVHERRGSSVDDSIVAAFAGKRALFVPDNCEHVLGTTAELIRRMVESSPTLVVLASSRERLGLRAERAYDVPPMAPNDGRALFVERAVAVTAAFEEDEHVAAICSAVDDLPLAIELAAARVRSLSARAIHERLAESLGLLTTRDRDVEERQRTLDATIGWSYDLLDAEEQRILRGLSVFAGGCTLAAAEAVAGADLEALESLLDKSLIRHRTDETGEDRYWMLETIREYAQRELERKDEAHEVGHRHTEFFLDVAGRVMTPLGFATEGHRELFVRDRANLREAHARALATRDGASAVRFVRCLSRLMGSLAVGDAADRYAKAVASLELPGATGDDRAYALVRTARMASLLGDVAHARDLLDEADVLFEELGDEIGIAELIAARCDAELRDGNIAAASMLVDRFTAIAEARDDPELRSWADWVVSWTLLARALEEDDKEAAERVRALITPKVADHASSATIDAQATWLAYLALSLFVLEEYSESIVMSQRSLRKLLELEAAVGMKTGRVSDPIFGVGLALCGAGDFALGISLVTAGRRQWREHGVSEESFTTTTLGRIERAARANLGEEAYDAARDAGEEMTRDEAVELALSIAPG